LLTLDVTILRLALHPHLLTLDAAGLLPLRTDLLPFLSLHGESLLAAVTLKGLALDGKAATTMPASATAAHQGSAAASTTAATVPTAACESGRTATATAVAATAAALDGCSLAAFTAALATRGLRYSRGRDRQSGDARGEKQPGHGNSPFERQKRSVRRTVPTSKRMKQAF
jgi:hypothetical protein